MGRKVTLAMIAAELGVSKTSVSNAFNHPEELSPLLREKILLRARQLGYSADPAARSLRMGRTGTIGVLMTEDLGYAFEDPSSVDFMAGVAQACTESSSSMLLIPAGTGEFNPDKAARLINQAMVDGFIIYSVAAEDPYLHAAQSRGLPTIICDQPTGVRGNYFVGIDDREAIKPAVRELLGYGHRRIGVLCIRLDRTVNNGPVSAQRLEEAQMCVQRSRVQGIIEVCAAEGIHDVPVIERHINTSATARSAAEELLKAHPEITAIVCTTDSMALGAREYVQSQGKKVPEYISITGFDGVLRAREAQISTIAQPASRKGYLCGKVLMDMIDKKIPLVPEKGNGENPLILDTQWVPGESIAPPRD